MLSQGEIMLPVIKNISRQKSRLYSLASSIGWSTGAAKQSLAQ